MQFGVGDDLKVFGFMCACVWGGGIVPGEAQTQEEG
jgi:hypothetical protein